MLLVVAVLLGVVGHSSGGGSGNGTGIAGLRTYVDLTRGHVTTPVHYPQSPPVGGDHNPIPQTCGAYDRPVPNERAVHSLEHGAVWITYRPGLAADQVDRLRTLADQPYILVSPYPGLSAPVVATAWGRQVQLTSASDARLAKFIAAFRAGPQAPEQGSACEGTSSAGPLGQS